MPSLEELKAALAEELKRVGPHADVAREIIAERVRQIEEEGWTQEHDDEHVDGEMAKAAAAYAIARRYPAGRLWPWHPKWWKPTEPRRDLVKAGALIIAEIERLDRAAKK